MGCFWNYLVNTTCTEISENVSGSFSGAGLNDYGQLGLGHTQAVTSFTGIPLADVVSISMGAKFSAAITASGDLYVCGINDLNQLTSQIPAAGIPVYTKIRSGVKSVHCATSFMIVVDLDDNVFFTGKGSVAPYDLYRSSQFSHPLDTTDFIDITVNFAPFTVHVAVSGSDYKLYLISQENGLPESHYFKKYQLSSASTDGTTSDDDTKYISIKSNPSGYSSDKVLQIRPAFANYTKNPPYEVFDVISGYYEFAGSAEFTMPPQSNEIYNIFSTGDAIFYTTLAGDLWARGNNVKGELGTGDEISVLAESGSNSFKLVATDVVDVVTVDTLTFIKKINGRWYAVGRNAYGSAGLGDTNDILNFKEIGKFNRLAANTYDTLVLS